MVVFVIVFFFLSFFRPYVSTAIKQWQSSILATRYRCTKALCLETLIFLFFHFIFLFSIRARCQGDIKKTFSYAYVYANTHTSEQGRDTRSAVCSPTNDGLSMETRRYALSALFRGHARTRIPVECVYILT
jgi:hypothetical protein